MFGGVTTTWVTVLKDHSIRNIGNHWARRRNYNSWDWSYISVWVLEVKPLFSEKAIKNVYASQNFPNVIKVCACILFLIWTCDAILYKLCLLFHCIKKYMQTELSCLLKVVRIVESLAHFTHHGHYIIHS